VLPADPRHPPVVCPGDIVISALGNLEIVQ
jgi:hypothetical protein